MKYIFLILFLSTLPTLVHGQILEKILGKSDDSLYIEKYPNKIHIRPFISGQSMQLELIDNDKKSLPVVYAPNINLYAGFDFNYKILGFALAFKIPPFEDIRKRMGETKYFNFKLSIATTHFGAEAYIQRSSGFYLFNAKDFIPKFSVLDDIFPQKENLSVFNFGVSAYYQKSKYFSQTAAFSQTKRQKKNAGSFLFMTSYLFSGIFNNDSLAPSNFANTLPNVASYRSGVYNSFILAPGYGYTYVIHDNFFATLVGFAGIGLQPQYSKYTDGSAFNFRAAYKLHFKGAIGYNGKMFFAGISGGIDWNSITLSEMNISIIPMYIKLGGGIRF